MEKETSPTTSKTNEKIGKVLQKFLEPDFKVRNDVYINQFLTHLVGKNDDDKTFFNDTDKLLKEQFFDWIIQASTLWDRKTVNPQGSILSFTLNLASRLSADEQIFVRLNCQNVFETLVGVAQTNSVKDPSVTLGFVKLLCSFLEHKSGVQWVMATTHWTDVTDLALKANTMYIRKKSYQFVIKLLEKTISFNRNFADNLVRIIIKPLKDIFVSLPSGKNSEHAQIKNVELFEALKPTLDFIIEVVEPLLKQFKKNVLQLFLEQETSQMIDHLLLLSQIEEFSFELLRIQFVFLFYKGCVKLEGVKVIAYESPILMDFRTMFNLIKIETEKNNVRSIIKICDFTNALVHNLASRLPTCVRSDEAIDYQNQMVIFMLMPTMCLSMQLVFKQMNVNTLLTDEFRREYIKKILKITAVNTIELCHKWAQQLVLRPNLIDDVVFSLQYMVKSKELLDKQRAATIFSPLVYSLKDNLTVMMETSNTAEWTRSRTLYITTIVDIIVELVESFDLTWKDSIETIWVMELACDVVQHPHWPDKVIIMKGLKLLNTAISKYMSPDMVLLIYNTKDSKVSQTGKLLYVKCHDSSWEVRDSALEVVYTLSLKANTKFPAFMNILLDAGLVQLVVQMALKDGEYYVRATAFKCLQELIQIPEIWDVLLTADNFLENILNVFENETEGIVRKEAATLIHKINAFQCFPEEMLPRLYDVMTHAAIGDLHWEVKYNALDFWFNVWEAHLIHQGMIDRMFPSYTFSKEHRKIVALNEAEVRKRIIKVLNQLSYIGGLHVMKCAIQDDCDLEVSKKATHFTMRLLKLLKIYKVTSEIGNLSEPPSPLIPGRSYQSTIEPPSPADSSTLTDPSPSHFDNFGSPQFSNSPFFDPVSPYSLPLSPSLDPGTITSPESVNSISMIQHQQEVPVQPRITPTIQQVTPFNPAKANEVVPDMRPTNGTSNIAHILGSGGMDFESSELKNVVSSNCFDSERTDNMLDEFLNSNDMTLLQAIYNPTDEVKNSTTKMKTRTYFAPSDYLKFIYNEVETHATEKTQWLNSLDAFDSLLDDILKEYNLDINNMDCY